MKMWSLCSVRKLSIDETFDLLLASLEVEDTGYEVLDDIFIASNK